MTRASASQTAFFYLALKALALGKFPAPGHPLRSIPVDPDQAGKTTSERIAVKALRQAAGGWTYKLRQAWYGYCASGRGVAQVHAALSFMTFYDDELRALLRSHDGDVDAFPRVHFWDEIGEAKFKKKIRKLDKGRLV